MKIILTGGEVAVIDDEDFDIISRYSWFLRMTGRKKERRYAVSNFINSSGKRRMLFMHRLILGQENEKNQIDHKDGDGLNNQKSNLRICTNSQNGCNKAKYKIGTSVHKGVRKVRNRWAAFIVLNRKQHWLGTFQTENQAAEAYNKKAMELHGEFARLNIIA
jgi:HNH endonuclease